MEYSSYLIHYGVKGQKWGERQYQYEDGTYTPLGKERRRVDGLTRRDSKNLVKYLRKHDNSYKNRKKINKIIDKTTYLKDVRDNKLKSIEEKADKYNYYLSRIGSDLEYFYTNKNKYSNEEFSKKIDILTKKLVENEVGRQSLYHELNKIETDLNEFFKETDEFKNISCSDVNFYIGETFNYIKDRYY